MSGFECPRCGRCCYVDDDETAKLEHEWVGLTDDEINSIRYKRDWTAPWSDTTFARAIEAKLKEKNMKIFGVEE